MKEIALELWLKGKMKERESIRSGQEDAEVSFHDGFQETSLVSCVDSCLASFHFSLFPSLPQRF